MTATAYLDYCYGDEVKIDSFCRLPRILVTNEFYRTVPAEIKILYGLMLDRVAMSVHLLYDTGGGASAQRGQGQGDAPF